MSVNTNISGESVTSAPSSGIVSRTGRSDTTITIVNSCFGTNLRGVGNPISPDAILTANLVVRIGSKDYTIGIDYPTRVVTNDGIHMPLVQSIDPDKIRIEGVEGVSAAIHGKNVVIRTPIPNSVTVNNTGLITTSQREPIEIIQKSFYQTILDCNNTTAVYTHYGMGLGSDFIPTFACGLYMGTTGELTATDPKVTASADNSNINIEVSFPGQTGFCGGYWSPLMLFFDDSRPRFDNVSSFPLNPLGKTRWPEAAAPGYFLALDQDASKKIEKAEQLFGDHGGHENGFEALRKLDSNKDGIIDKKDKLFKKLVLWKDVNGDGVSQADEVSSLSERVTKISLKYVKGTVETMGRYAEARERSKFWYKEKGKIKKGDIIDIWLSPAETKLSQK